MRSPSWVGLPSGHSDVGAPAPYCHRLDDAEIVELLLDLSVTDVACPGRRQHSRMCTKFRLSLARQPGNKTGQCLVASAPCPAHAHGLQDDAAATRHGPAVEAADMRSLALAAARQQGGCLPEGDESLLRHIDTHRDTWKKNIHTAGRTGETNLQHEKHDSAQKHAGKWSKKNALQRNINAVAGTTTFPTCLTTRWQARARQALALAIRMRRLSFAPQAAPGSEDNTGSESPQASKRDFCSRFRYALRS
jgi:hypothetical protein